MEEEIIIQKDLNEQILQVWYEPRSERSIYDICDINGSVIKTGSLQEDGTRVDISELEKSEYLLLILDGEDILKRKISLKGEEE